MTSQLSFKTGHIFFGTSGSRDDEKEKSKNVLLDYKFPFSSLPYFFLFKLLQLSLDTSLWTLVQQLFLFSLELL